MENQESKTCENCRYFRRHYVRGAGNRYTPLTGATASTPG